MRKFVLYFMVFGLFFVAFDKVSEPKLKEEVYASPSEYVFNFDEVTKEGEKIVLFDNHGLEHVQYYVMEFSGEQCATYTYYYMGDHESYTDKYAEVSSKVVDYNYDEYMIKTLDNIEYSTYDEVMDFLEVSLENDELYIIY